MDIETILEGGNLAERLSDDKLEDIGRTVVEHYKTDCDSRMAWEDAYTKWQDMAAQKIEHKSKPWPGAANLKYPLVTNAAMQFNARAMPALLPNNEPVGAAPIGADPDGQKRLLAQHLARHMNYQLTEEMDEWEEEFDKLIMSLCISGMEFKKTYFDPKLRRIVSRHVTPLQLVINYWASDLATARKTEIFQWNKNEIEERIRAGRFVEVDWETTGDPNPLEPTDAHEDNKDRHGQEAPSIIDSSTPFVVLEYHGWWDMDDDGYEEPYIITVLEQTEQVLAIYPRFDEEDVVMNAEGRIQHIIGRESYTKYGFVPNPDGSFYHIAFGQLLYPINAVVNTTANQLIDAGTLQTMSTGFVGRGAKLKQGMFSMRAGKWLSVNAMGDDLRKSIVPMPAPDPSPTLMALLQFMVDSGRQMSATTEIFVGENPGQNQKATTTQAVREEGQKVFTAIYKRLRRALKKELYKIFELNNIILTSGEATTKVHESAALFQVEGSMYDGMANSIQPSADPNLAIKEQKMQKDGMVMETIMATGIGNVTAAQRRLFTTMEVENVDELVPPDAQRPPDPKAIEAEQKSQLELGKLEIERMRVDLEERWKQFEAQLEQAKLELEGKKLQADMVKAGAEAVNKDADRAVKVKEIEMKASVEQQKAKDAKAKQQSSGGSTGS